MVIADADQAGRVATGYSTRGAQHVTTCEYTHALFDTFESPSPRVFTGDATEDVSERSYDLDSTLTELSVKSPDFADAEVSPEMLTCTQCGGRFVNRQALFKHVKEKHQQHAHAARRKFRCDQCQRSFKSMTALRNHARTHPSYFEARLDDTLLNTSSIHENSSLHVSDTETSHSCTDTTFTILDASKADSTLALSPVSDLSDKLPDPVVDKEPTLPERLAVSDFSSVRSTRRRSGIPVSTRRRSSVHGFSYSLNNSGGLNKHNTSEGQNSVTYKKVTSGHISNQSSVTAREICSTPVRGRPERGVISKTPSRAAMQTQARQMDMDRTPVNSNSTTRHTRIHTKTPKSQRKTPMNQKKTRMSQKKTPMSQKNTPKSQKATPKTPRSKREAVSNAKKTPAISKKDVLNSAKKTPASCPKTPSRTQFKCVKCGKSFVDKTRLEVHFAVHARETPERCGIPKETLRRNLLKSQTSTVSPSVQMKYECHQCGQAYDKLLFLDAHLKTHSKDTPYKCEFCNKQFKYMSSLKAHSFVHRGEERTDAVGSADSVTTTGSGYNTRAASLHRNVFSILSDTLMQTDLELEPEMPFACKSCDYKTNSPAELLKHLKIHARVGPYTCSTCSKSFKVHNNLKTHEKLHSIQRLKEILVVKSNKRCVWYKSQC